MRVLLGLDGSAAANRARDVVGTVAWPAGTTIRLVSALATNPELFGGPWVPVVPVEVDRYESEAQAEFIAILEGARDQLAGPGRTVEVELLRGSPTRVIVDEMRTWRPDLTVVGSRGHGSIGSALLGSVSAAVVDHSTAPVLVVRGDRIGRLVFAEDGSEDAAAAASIVTGWPIFAGLPVSVLGVVDVAAPWRTGIAPTMFSAALDVYSEMLENARSEYRETGERTAATFRAAGLDATVELREGDPAGQIAAAATDPAGDVIVIGSRGHTGLSRLVLGSVAHSVLLHAHASVLIVRHVGDVKSS